MSTEDKIIISKKPKLAAPRIDLKRIHSITTYEVMESDLRNLEDAANQEKDAMAFGSLFLGALISAILGWPSSESAVVRYTVHVALTAIFAVFTLWFGVVWIRKRNTNKRILDEIRSRSRMETHESIRIEPADDPAEDATA